MGDETEVPPELPGEVWRGTVGGVLYSVAPWLTRPFVTWKWVGPVDGDTWVETSDDGEIATIEALGAWAMSERDRAEQAERDARLAATLTKAAQDRERVVLAERDQAHKDCNGANEYADRLMKSLEDAGEERASLRRRVRDLESDLAALRAVARDRL